MNVSNSNVGLNSYSNSTQRPKNPEQPKEVTPEQKALLTGAVDHKSTQNQIDAYVKGTKDTNEVYDKATGDTETAKKQATVEFAQDVQKSNNFTIALNNGVDFSKIMEAKSPLSDLQKSVENFNQVNADAKRAENVNTYAQNSNYLY